MRVLKPIDFVVGWLHKNIDPFLSKSIGDLSQYFEHTVWSASIRHRLEEIVIDMLNTDAIEDVTIVAHSMGCLVSYEVLSKDEDVAMAVAELKKTGKSKNITLVSFGSAINLSFDMVRQPIVSLEAKQRIDEPFAPEITGHVPGEPDRPGIFHWMDIHSRLDPVPAGFPSAILLGENDALSEEQVEQRSIINMDDLFQDHGAYWHNREQVMVRIAKAINGGKYPWASLEPTREILVKRVKSASTWVIFRGIAVILGIAAAIVFRPLWLLIGLGVVLVVDAITLLIARALSRY
jgi:hypothetical protein